MKTFHLPSFVAGCALTGAFVIGANFVFADAPSKDYQCVSESGCYAWEFTERGAQRVRFRKGDIIGSDFDPWGEPGWERSK